MNSEMREQVTLFAKVFGPVVLIGTFGFFIWINYAFFFNSNFRDGASVNYLLGFDLFLICGIVFTWITLKKAWKDEL